MATELLASGIAEADSSAVTLADGARAVLFLTGPAAQGAAFSGSVAVQFQTAGGGWSTVYLMDGTRRTARVDGPTTFRVRRPSRDERSLAVGVDRA